MRYWLVVLVGMLTACVAPRPDGAYTPVEPAKPPPDYTEADDLGDDAPPDQSPNKDASTPKPPMDASELEVPATGPYAKLAGHYLMRMDLYSTVDATRGMNHLLVENRVSNLWWVTLGVQDGKLISDEQLCAQTYLHTCKDGCSAWETKLDVALGKSFFPKYAKVSREYEIAGGTLTAGQVTLPLGFIATDPTPDTPLPTSTSDANLWHLEPAGAAAPDPNRVGMRTVIQATLKSLPFKCAVVTVQSLTTSFSIEGIKLSDSQALTEGYHRLNTDSSHIETIYTLAYTQLGSGGSSATADLCTVANFRTQSPKQPLDAVIFKRTDLGGCPPDAAAFESALPGSVSRPSLP